MARFFADGAKSDQGHQSFLEHQSGPTRGTVIKKQTRATKIKSHKVAASKTEPEYIVQSRKSGKRAAHKRSALKKI